MPVSGTSTLELSLPSLLMVVVLGRILESLPHPRPISTPLVEFLKMLSATLKEEFDRFNKSLVERLIPSCIPLKSGTLILRILPPHPYPPLSFYPRYYYEFVLLVLVVVVLVCWSPTSVGPATNIIRSSLTCVIRTSVF